MAQRLIQEQSLQQVQQQRLTQRQMMLVKMLEMPLAELEENILTELDENPALDENHDDLSEGTLDSAGPDDPSGPTDSSDSEDASDDYEREEREDALDSALEEMGSDDAMPTADDGRDHQPAADADYEETVWGDTTSFYDKLKEQMGELDLTETDRQVMEYLIGSLDGDGLLRKPLDDLADELAIYHSLDVEERDVERVLRQLHTFDPAGIGARTLQECLLLQIDRRQEGRLKELMQKVISRYFDDFTHKRWERIQAALQLTDEQAEVVSRELRKLNPKPGAALGETMGRSTQQITPDFIVDTDEDGHVTFSISRGRIPELTVSSTFTDMVQAAKGRTQQMNRQEREALVYAREKVERAQNYIDAVKQRRRTLYVTMKAIVDWQKRFFLDGDEADLKPMILKDIAEKTGLDVSTISRVSNIKYVQTRWGTFPLRFFFTDSYVTKEGEEMSTRKIKLALKDLIGEEEPGKPQSDDQLAAEMKKRGFPIARRTVAKYREQLGIPVARLRK